MSSVNLVGITHPNETYTGCKTANELVAWAARVSNPSNQNNIETAPKLVKYLIKNQHWSPLEMVSIQLEVKTTRDIARQLLRHRSFSFQEYSQRYADPTKELGVIHREARMQDVKNRQNSIEAEDVELTANWQIQQEHVTNASLTAYRWAIKNGIAKEQARAVLPEGMTESVVIVAGTLRSWVHYCKLRCDIATQKEHRIVADQCWAIIKEHFPEIDQALTELKEI